MDKHSKNMYDAAKAGRAKWLKDQEFARRMKKFNAEMKKSRRDAYVMSLANFLNEARKRNDVEEFYNLLMSAKL